MADPTTQLTITINDTPANILNWINRISKNANRLKQPKIDAAEVQFFTTTNLVVEAVTAALPPSAMLSSLNSALQVAVPVIPPVVQPAANTGAAGAATTNNPTTT
jgi:hypothetical protein